MMTMFYRHSISIYQYINRTEKSVCFKNAVTMMDMITLMRHTLLSLITRVKHTEYI